jgi:uncharacterized NAD-dependent epimerase/dehydratase family protein
MQNALVLTHGLLTSPNAKTCHGLLRGSKRFRPLAVIDYEYVGQDAGQVLDGIHRGVPIFASVDDYFANPEATQPDCCVIGVALPGGILPDDFREQLKRAVAHGLGLVNGLHTFLSDDEEFEALAAQHQVTLTDVRKPRPRTELQFWTGDIYSVTTPIIAVLGTDCALGKRTTARWLVEAAQEAGLRAEMIYTGQTGWMQGSPYGFIFDSTVNDFIGGEMEKAIVQCFREAHPDLIFLEGQSALRNPSGPCGSEYLLCGNAKGVILQHAPGRVCFEGSTVPISGLARDLELIRLYGAEVLAIALNGEGLTAAELIDQQNVLRKQTGLPVVRPLEEGVAEIMTAVMAYKDRLVGT